MTREVQLDNAFAFLGDQLGLCLTRVGNLNELSTANKANLVVALNEISNALTQVPTADDIATAVQQAKDELIGGASANLDTFQEIAAELANNDDASSAIMEAMSNRLRVDAAQTFSPEQKAQGRANLGAAAAADVTALNTQVGALQNTADARDAVLTGQSAQLAALSQSMTTASAKANANETAINALTAKVGNTETNYVNVITAARDAAMANAA